MDALKTIQRLTKLTNLFGLSQIRQETIKKKTSYKLDKKRTIYTIILLIFYVTVVNPFYFYISIDIDKTRKFDFRQAFAKTFYTAGHLLCVVIAIGNNLHKRTIFCEILNELENEMDNLKDLANINEVKTPGRGYLTAYIVFLVAIGIMDVYYYLNTAWVYFALEMIIELTGILFTVLMSLQFSIFALNLSAILNVLGEGFEKYLTEFIHRPKLINSSKILQRFRNLYHEIHETCEKIDKYFSSTNLWMIFFMTFVTIVSSYNRLDMLVAIMRQKSGVSFMRIVEMLVWSFYGIIMVAGIILASENVRQKLEKTLVKFLLRSEDPDVTKELKMFLSLLGYEKMRFSPHGLFTLSKKLTITILGGCVTYLMIFLNLPKNLKTAEKEIE